MNMRIFWTLLLMSAFPILVMGQSKQGAEQKSNNEVRHTQFSIGYGAGLDHYFNTYKPYRNLETTPHKYEDILQYCTGIQLDWKFPNKFGIRTGARYALKGYKLDYNWVNGYITSESLVPEEKEYRQSYVEIPFGITYSVLKKGVYELAPSFGVKSGLLFHLREVTKYADGSEEKIFGSDDNASFYISAIRIGFINNLDFAQNWVVSFEPYVMGNLIPINDAIENSDWVAGAFLSINYRII